MFFDQHCTRPEPSIHVHIHMRRDSLVSSRILLFVYKLEKSIFTIRSTNKPHTQLCCMRQNEQVNILCIIYVILLICIYDCQDEKL